MQSFLLQEKKKTSTMETLTEAQELQIAKIVRRELEALVKRVDAEKFKSVLSIGQAAEILDCGETFIRTLLRSGRLVKVKIEGRTYVSVRSMKELQKPL